jgi:hypothetical protein
MLAQDNSIRGGGSADFCFLHLENLRYIKDFKILRTVLEILAISKITEKARSFMGKEKSFCFKFCAQRGPEIFKNKAGGR